MTTKTRESTQTSRYSPLFLLYLFCFSFGSFASILAVLTLWSFWGFNSRNENRNPTNSSKGPLLSYKLFINHSYVFHAPRQLLDRREQETEILLKTCLSYLISMSSEMSQPAVSTEWLKKSQESTKEHLSVLDTTWFPDKDASSDYSK